MKALLFAGALLSLWQPTAANPISARGVTEETFLGLDLTTAKEDCTPEQFAVILETARKVAHEFAPKALEQLQTGIYNDGAFHAFFLGRGMRGPRGEWTTDLKNELKQNYDNAIRFPLEGPAPRRNGGPSLIRKAKIRCKVNPSYQSDLCAENQAGAYTYDPNTSGAGYEIQLCPLFFTDRIPYLARVTETGINGRKHPDDIERLLTKEHVLLHEYFHVKNMGYRVNGAKIPITDYKEYLPDCGKNAEKVYGAGRCHQFAFLYLRPDEPASSRGINEHVLLNADTYAWYATAVWFQTHWGWKYNSNDKVNPWKDGPSAWKSFSLQKYNYDTVEEKKEEEKQWPPEHDEFKRVLPEGTCPVPAEQFNIDQTTAFMWERNQRISSSEGIY